VRVEVRARRQHNVSGNGKGWSRKNNNNIYKTGKSAYLKAVHWPEFSMAALMTMAWSMEGFSTVLRSVLGPPVLAMRLGHT
jgi:hypothetical protein